MYPLNAIDTFKEVPRKVDREIRARKRICSTLFQIGYNEKWIFSNSAKTNSYIKERQQIKGDSLLSAQTMQSYNYFINSQRSFLISCSISQYLSRKSDKKRFFIIQSNFFSQNNNKNSKKYLKEYLHNKNWPYRHENQY